MRVVDIKTATASEFDAVAARKGRGYEIVRYCEERGGFTNLCQFEVVPGTVEKADGQSAALTLGAASIPRRFITEPLRARLTYPRSA